MYCQIVKIKLMGNTSAAKIVYTEEHPRKNNIFQKKATPSVMKSHPEKKNTEPLSSS